MSNLIGIEGHKREGFLHKITSRLGYRAITIVLTLIITNLANIASIIIGLRVQGSWVKEHLFTFLMGTQAVIIILVIWIPIKEPSWLDEDSSQSSDIAAEASSKFINYWKFLWLSWFLLYVMLAYQKYPGIRPDLSNWGGVSLNRLAQVYWMDLTVDFLNNLATFMILFCYFILSEPTSITHKRRQINWAGWIGILVFFTILEAVCLGYIVPFFDEKKFILNQQQIVGGYVVIVELFKWVSGIGAAAIMALFFGRLSSKFIECPTWLLVLFYLYAALQPSYPRIGNNDLITAIIFVSALLLKCLLFAYIAILTVTGRFRFYFIGVQGLNEQVNDDWRAFSKLKKKAS